MLLFRQAMLRACRVLAILCAMALSVVLTTTLLAVPSSGEPDRTAGKSKYAGKKAGKQARKQLGSQVKFGAYVDQMTLQPHLLGDFESLLGRRTDIASYYWGFGDVFPGPVELAFADGGRRDVLLSWDMGQTRFAEWARGDHDAYLDTLVLAANLYPYDYYVRPWPEMNGDWQEFQPTTRGERPHGGTHAEFKAAWRYVVTYFRTRGADNVKWVFNPTADVYRGTTPVRKIWPGKRYVDVLGLDGFNWGRDSGWGRWRSFEDIFAKQYKRLTRLHPKAPVWICEVGSKEPRASDGAPIDARSSKARWIRDALRSTRFPQVEAMVWFHALKERDWRIDSSPAALKALQRGLTPRRGFRRR